jgi:hypothetical protein
MTMGTVTVQDQQALLDATAVHEVGHAVMRWIVGWPATEVFADYGHGFCKGTGNRVLASDLLMVTLAGYAAELPFGTIDWETSRTDDFELAKQILLEDPYLRLVPNGRDIVDATIVESLDWHFKYVRELLWPHFDFIDSLSVILATVRRLSPRQVAAYLREYSKTNSNGNRLSQTNNAGTADRCGTLHEGRATLRSVEGR